jgi:hypothetical protein
MRYISTRARPTSTADSSKPTFSEILLGGLAPDGGLYLPEAYPRISPSELAGWRGLSYADLACAVLARFIDDIPPEDLRALIHRTYTPAIYSNGRNPSPASEITPLRWLEPPAPERGEGGLAILELSNGPTLAFKDMAMQLLGNLFRVRAGQAGGGDQHPRRHLGRHRFVGGVRDARQTRRARLHALAARANERLPARADVLAAGCQHLQHRRARHVRRRPGHRQGGVERPRFQGQLPIGAVNSINWARVAAQVVYYFKGYFAATGGAGGNDGQQVAFAVPSGNFGNICAGHIARMMGLPIGRLVLATNENDVLDEFFRTGVYRPRATSRNLRHLESVDGHLEGLELRALRFRSGWPRSRRSFADCGRRSIAGGSFDLSARLSLPACPNSASFPAAARTPTAWRRSAGPISLRPDDRYAYRRRAQGRQRTPHAGDADGRPGDGLAGQVRGNDRRSTRAQARATRRLQGLESCRSGWR